ncbi:MAG: Aerobic carbon monoxide dehydrogenase (quinone), large chain [uncultured Solirubrobacteraceae bacterium]|uniref:Aerobic carbon monoxide dehydrogenase (Quinone), large chain n=1 Tax=uncultured Solirubrobacteraceae bacterium TaxID=1162706 RepID=A0A6J4RS53_9ACTN|nr:MAG: Aerobic carbon monoxide dehydrogenase (quinone), large chain [uncultured Solirubrobacteraceae bacterium]
MTLMDDRAATGHVGRSLRRKEDPRLITGQATYVDDIAITGMLHAAFVRSPEAHARIVSIDASAALERDDVVAVFTGKDMSDLGAPLPMAWAPDGVEVNNPEHWPLARDTVKHVGDPVAVVLSQDRYAAVDAAEEVLVEYEPLPVVTDIETALDEGAPLVHEQFGTNRSHEWSLGGGDLEAGFAEAEVIVERRVVNHRISGAPIEPRGVLANYKAGAITVHSSTQVPHFVRLFMAILLGINEERVRIIAPEVGGGFGAKLQVTGEEIICAWASRKSGRPVKWVETRSEHMAVTHHGRDQVATIRIGAKRDGTLTALHARILADMGAYLMLLTPTIPSLGAFVMSGVYRIPAVQTDITGVFTNKVATDAIRGAGRPEATHMIEVGMDQLADELGMDRLELRRKNFIPKEEFPAEVAYGIVYDSGDYAGALDKLLTHVDLEAFEQERAEQAAKGIARGIGFSTYTEICGLAPSRVTGPAGFGLQTGLWESAIVRVTVTGNVMVYTGTSPHGQGHETTMAQVVADKLGVDPQQVEILHGDTATGAMGLGTYGSRTTAVGTESVARAADAVARKSKAIVAHALEAAPEDIELQDGRFIVAGSPDKGMTLAEISGMAHVRPELLPEDMSPGLDETSFYDPNNFVFPFGAHACVVDVELDTGKVKVVRYVAVDDCGPAINPMLIDGQVHGGIAHAIGQALYEHIEYDEEGQLVTGTFVDYALPTAAEMPMFETDRTETPSPVNSLGVKGIGEAGTIAATPAVTNAVIDALRPHGVTYLNMPLTSERVWRAIEEAQS